MHYHQLLYLVSAVQYGSIRQAAKALNVTQPNLSTAIIGLEKEMGVKLLVRTNKGVVVTPEGRRVTAIAQDIVNKTAMLQNLYRGEHPAQPIHILSVATNPSQIALDALAKLKHEIGEDDLRVTVRNYSVMGCTFSVKNLESEIGVVFITSGEHQKYTQAFHENQLEYNLIATRRCCVNVSRHNPLYNRENIAFGELLAFPLARFVEDGLSLLDTPREPGQSGFLDFQQVFYFDSDCSILNFVRETNAVKIGYSWCRESYESTGIHCLEVTDDVNPIELGWIRRKNQTLTDVGQLFVNTLMELYGGDA